ncbi:MAG: YdcF family protein [Pseudomonadota bacterium]
MFTFLKILESVVLPPGIFVLILTVIGFMLFRKKIYRIAMANLLAGCCIWALSISPVSHFLMKGLESPFSISPEINGDVIILLGAGLREDVRDFSGTGFPDGDMLGRIVTAVRLHRQYKLPILITSGKVYEQGQAGSPVDRRILTDLGVPPESIMIETRSRNTYENALQAFKICRSLGYRKPILLTAAYHLRRARMAFEAAGLSAIPYPAYRNASENPTFFWKSYLPSHHAFQASSVAIREYLGILYYMIRY